MKIDTLEKFLQEITYLDKNTDIYKIYRSFLSDCINSSEFSFIVGTNDSLGVKNSNKLREFHGAYDLEYGSNKLCLHKDSIKPGQKVLVVDDLLATGGTVEATIKLVEELGGVVAGLAFLIELVDLKGRERLDKYPIITLMQY